jgi:hypothetical protein
MENELNKQTAVEWLVEKLQESGISLMTDEFEMIQQAKQIDKEQRIQDMSKMQIISDVDFDGDVTFMFNPKEYYNETYGKKTFLDLVSDEESKVHEIVKKLKEKKK